MLQMLPMLLDHRPVLEEVGAVDVVAVAQEDVEAEPLVDAEVSREALGADRVPGHVGPAHALGVAAQVRLRCRRCHGEGDVASVQEAELGDAVGERRAADAPGVGPAVDALLEEEPVEDELAAPVEQLGQRPLARRDLRSGSRARPAPSACASGRRRARAWRRRRSLRVRSWSPGPRPIRSG